MARPPDDDAARARKQAALLALVRPVAEDLWREVEGGPTLELVAARTGYTPDGLDKALRRLGTSWGAEKEATRRLVLDYWAFLSVVAA